MGRGIPAPRPYGPTEGPEISEPPMKLHVCYHEFPASQQYPTGGPGALWPPAERPHAGRVVYIKKIGTACHPVRVITDFFPDGTEDFSAQEFGEVCWYSYTPSEAERTFAIGQLHATAR